MEDRETVFVSAKDRGGRDAICHEAKASSS